MFAAFRVAGVAVAAALVMAPIGAQAPAAPAPAGNRAPAASKPTWPIAPPPTTDGVDRAALGREAAAGGAPAIPQPPSIPRSAMRPAFPDANPAPTWGDPGRRRSRTDPYESPEDSFGYRNPGGVGRMSEYYPPGDQFQSPGTTGRPAATHGLGATSRAEQLASYNAGTARYNAIQGHIDRYGSPRIGFGWGFGFGMGAGLPF